MSRVPQKSTSHGSLKNLQILINHCPEILNMRLAECFGKESFPSIKWVSPKKDDDFSEYKDEDFLNRLNIRDFRVPLDKFWPANGPQWDALGIDSKNCPILFEAKANIPELRSPGTSASEASAQFIKRSLRETKVFLNATGDADWAGTYYQYTNRLAHLYFLRVLNDIPAKLVFLYFINDSTVAGPTSEGEWDKAISEMKAFLGIGRHSLDSYIGEVFIDADEIKKGNYDEL